MEVRTPLGNKIEGSEQFTGIFYLGITLYPGKVFPATLSTGDKK